MHLCLGMGAHRATDNGLFMGANVAIIGCGAVGTTTAFALLIKGVAERLLLTSRSLERAEGEAADLRHASAFVERPVDIIAGPIDVIAGAGVIVITASVRLAKTAPDRRAFFAGNCELFRTLIPRIVELAPQACLVIVSNPVDLMTYAAWRWSGFPAPRVLGTGTLIDSGRFRQLLSGRLGVHPEDIRAYILGEHGDQQFPALSIAVTGGERLTADDSIRQTFNAARESGRQVMIRKGHTNFAIALATTMIVESIVRDARRTLPVSTLLNGYEGVHNVCLSIPAIVGRGGVIRALQPALSAEEGDQLRQSARDLRSMLDGVRW